MRDRHLTPELLDALPFDSAEACHGRRDLRRINRVMGNRPWIRHRLRRFARLEDTVVEFGAGDGWLGRGLLDLGLRWHGVDLAPRPAAWPVAWAWTQGDLRSFTDWPSPSLLVANLILHHFDDRDLRTLGRAIDRHVRVLIAREPERRRRWQWSLAVLARLLGAHAVTRHDGHVSIAAGFRAGELVERLGLPPDRWQWRCGGTLRGAYACVAWRRAS
jgi:hypothetical protein